MPYTNNISSVLIDRKRRGGEKKDGEERRGWEGQERRQMERGERGRREKREEKQVKEKQRTLGIFPSFRSSTNFILKTGENTDKKVYKLKLRHFSPVNNFNSRVLSKKLLWLHFLLTNDLWN